MANINDCKNKKIKISKNSITIKSEDGKTAGVVKNIITLYDMQANKQMQFYRELKKIGCSNIISIKDIIVIENKMYVIRNIKSKLFNEAHGYFSEEEQKKAEEKEAAYTRCKEAGIEVIECIFA